jgi:hypothetical protein
MAICYNLWPFGIVCVHLVYFSQFGMFGPRKIWQPGLEDQSPAKNDKQFFRSFSLQKPT